MTVKRFKPAHRKQMILSAALHLAERLGYSHITRAEVAVVAHTAPALVSHYFPLIDTLKDAVMCEAVRMSNVAVVAQGLGMRHPVAMAAPDDLKGEAARWMVK